MTVGHTQASRPNVVFILSDDQSWTDYGFMDHEQIETPVLDKLASESLTYTRGYVTAPLYRPSLAFIFTGVFPNQHRITGNDPKDYFVATSSVESPAGRNSRSIAQETPISP
ncbi:MAG: sulfatase-like hydrolase/transferase [Verrucomicrobiota bacterium]